MSPHFANVTGHCNCHPSACDGIAYPVFQFKAIKPVSRSPCIDVLRKRGTSFPGPRNCWEVPDDQIVLHKVDSRPVTRSRNRTIQELRLIHAMVNTSRLWPQNSASTQGGVISAVINLKAHRSKSRTFNRTSTVIGDWKTLNIECIQAQTESLQLQLPTTKSGSDDDLKAEM